jgi:hypothetical protein
VAVAALASQGAALPAAAGGAVGAAGVRGTGKEPLLALERTGIAPGGLQPQGGEQSCRQPTPQRSLQASLACCVKAVQGAACGVLGGEGRQSGSPPGQRPRPCPRTPHAAPCTRHGLKRTADVAADPRAARAALRAGRSRWQATAAGLADLQGAAADRATGLYEGAATPGDAFLSRAAADRATGPGGGAATSGDASLSRAAAARAAAGQGPGAADDAAADRGAADLTALLHTVLTTAHAGAERPLGVLRLDARATEPLTVARRLAPRPSQTDGSQQGGSEPDPQPPDRLPARQLFRQGAGQVIEGGVGIRSGRAEPRGQLLQGLAPGEAARGRPGQQIKTRVHEYHLSATRSS